MKKVVFMFVAVAAISLASCGGNNNAEGVDSTADTTTVAVDSTADSTATDTTAATPADTTAAAADTTAAPAK